MKTVRKIYKKIGYILLGIVLFYGALTIFKNSDNLPFFPSKAVEETISTTFIKETIAPVAEIATLSYGYTNMGQFEDQKVWNGWQLPLTTKKFIVQYQGEMKIGILAAEMEVDIENDTIYIKIPKATLLSHGIKEETIEVFDQSHNILNPLEIEDYTYFALEQKEVMEAQAKSDGFFERAEEISKEQLQVFLTNIPLIAEKYVVEIEVMDEKNLKDQAYSK